MMLTALLLLLLLLLLKTSQSFVCRELKEFIYLLFNNNFFLLFCVSSCFKRSKKRMKMRKKFYTRENRLSNDERKAKMKMKSIRRNFHSFNCKLNRQSGNLLWMNIAFVLSGSLNLYLAIMKKSFMSWFFHIFSVWGWMENLYCEVCGNFCRLGTWK